MLRHFPILHRWASLSQPPNRLTGGHFAIVTDDGIVIATAADSFSAATTTGVVAATVEIGIGANAAMMTGAATAVEATAGPFDTTVYAEGIPHMPAPGGFAALRFFYDAELIISRVYVRLMETPPSTSSALPVVKLDASEAR